MNSHIKQITMDQLQVGMFIADNNEKWIPDNNFTRKGMVNRPEVIEAIRALGVKNLYIDISKGKDTVPDSSSSVNKSPNKLPKPRVSLQREVKNAKDIQGMAVRFIEHCMSNIQKNNVVDFKPVEAITNDLIQSLSGNYNALLCITQMRQKDRYLMEHSFNVSVYMGFLAMSLGFTDEKLNEIVMGALLHDLGKIRVDDRILHKPGSLSPDEWDEMKRHVDYGEAILGGQAGINQVMLDICVMHHERLDGSGYPKGLVADDIPLHARMACVCDVYDAMTAARVYHKGIAPTVALKAMLKMSEELDRDLVYHLIQALGVYPVGSVVELSNNKLAIVLESNPQNKSKPRVLQMYDVRTRRYDNKQNIDLADDRCSIHILKAVSAESFGIRIGDFL